MKNQDIAIILISLFILFKAKTKRTIQTLSAGSWKSLL